MRCEVTESEDATTLYLRYEIVPEGREQERLEALGGPLRLVLPARDYVDVGGTHHDAIEVEVPIHPHPGRRNRGQAKFTDYEARRAFWEQLQATVVNEVTNFAHDAAPGSVGVEGHTIRPASQAV